GKIMVEYFTSTAETLAAQIDRSRELIEERGTPLQRAWLFNSLALLGLRRERYRASEETVEQARKGWELLEQVEARQEVSDIGFIYAFSLLWADRLDEAESHLLEILAEADRVGYATVQARCVAYLALIGRKRGRVEEARRWAERTLAVAETGGMAEYAAAAEAHLAWAALREGRLDEAAPRARRAHAEGRTMGGAYRVLTWITAWPLLGVELAEGNVDEAAGLARELLSPEAQPAPDPVARALAEAVGAIEDSDPEGARERLAEAARLAASEGYL
ncbi:MAG TPA: hypothetical protein VFS53_06670, partial [Gemmatimonadota bacterium]|nr:hypothetical protein [Gemmatimonadota bacterium]